MYWKNYKFLLILLLILLIGGATNYYLGVITTSKKLSKQIDILEKKLTTSDSLLKEADAELQLCYSDMASITANSTTKYNFSTFGIYHPDLEGQDVTSTVYKYKNSQIVLNSAQLKGSIPEAYINVWLLKKKGTLSNNSDNFTNFPTFGGYENHGTPVYVSETMQLWNEKDIYKSKNGSVYHYSYHSVPKEIRLVSLDYYSSFSPAGGPIFVEIFQNVEPLTLAQYQSLTDYSVLNNLNSPRIVIAKQKLQKIVEQLEIKL